jgi:hypothetical protein
MARNKYFIMLVCEVCHSPQANKKYEVSTPNKEVMTLVPLARRGLKVACGLNSLLGLGRIFGIPVPTADSASFSSARSFLQELERETLEDYKHLQAIANNFSRSSQGPVSPSTVSGFSAREFQAFLEAAEAGGTGQT